MKCLRAYTILTHAHNFCEEIVCLCKNCVVTTRRHNRGSQLLVTRKELLAHQVKLILLFSFQVTSFKQHQSHQQATTKAMYLRSWKYYSTYVLCHGMDNSPFIVKREDLTASEIDRLPHPSGQLLGRCYMAINLNPALDSAAFLIDQLPQRGQRLLFTEGLVKWALNHFSYSVGTFLDVHMGMECEMKVQDMRRILMAKVVDFHLIESFEEFHWHASEMHHSPLTPTLNYCSCPHGCGHYMTIGEERINCYFGYRIQNYPDYQSYLKFPFEKYTRDLVVVLILEAASQIKKNQRKTCSLDDLEAMARDAIEKLDQVIIGSSQGFLFGARVAFNSIMNLDDHDPLGWNTVKEVTEPAYNSETDFEGHPSDDSQATRTYPMPI